MLLLLAWNRALGKRMKRHPRNLSPGKAAAHAASSATTRADDSGKLVKRGSCPGCGAAVTVDIDLIPEVVGVIASSLDTPVSFIPEFELWTCRAHPWDPPHPSLRQFESGFDLDVIVPRLRR